MKEILINIMFLLICGAGLEVTEDFNSGDLNKWEIISGNWLIQNNTLRGTSSSGDGVIFLKSKIYENFILECKIKVENREGSLAFRALDKDNLYILVFNPKVSPDSQGSILLIRKVKGKETYFAGAEQYVVPNCWVNIKLIVEGEKINVYVNNRFVLSVDDENFKRGKVGMRIFGDIFTSCNTYYDDFSVKPLGK